jgi:hypothetical protein
MTCVIGWSIGVRRVDGCEWTSAQLCRSVRKAWRYNLLAIGALAAQAFTSSVDTHIENSILQLVHRFEVFKQFENSCSKACGQSPVRRREVALLPNDGSGYGTP